MKNGKAAGLDEMLTEEIKNFGPVTMQSAQRLRDNTPLTETMETSTSCCPSETCKWPIESENFRPIPLLCHLYKMYERLIQNRLSPIIEHVLIQEQAGFRPGKSFTAQVLNLTQHIEDVFDTCVGKITGIFS